MTNASKTENARDDLAAVNQLSRAECLKLLSTEHLGRLAVAGPAPAPIIRPINYVFDAHTQSVVFRSVEGSKFHRLVRETHAAFEVDGRDEATRTAWSVIVIGVTEEVNRAHELRWLETLPLDSWVLPRGEGHWMRIRAWTVSGRRIGTGQPWAPDPGA